MKNESRLITLATERAIETGQLTLKASQVASLREQIRSVRAKNATLRLQNKALRQTKGYHRSESHARYIVILEQDVAQLREQLNVSRAARDVCRTSVLKARVEVL